MSLCFLFTEFISNAVHLLPLRRGFSYGPGGELTSTLVEKVIDQDPPESIEDCYVSPEGKQSWARFDIPWSAVTHVNILNVPTGKSECKTLSKYGLFIYHLFIWG